MFQALVSGQRRSGADMLSLFGAESPDGKGSGWARFLTFRLFVSLVEVVCSCWLYVILEVRVHVSSPCGWSGEVRGRYDITFWSRVTGLRRAEVGTVSDFFRLLGRIGVFLLVVCHTKCQCACFKPLWAVRGGQGPTRGRHAITF